MVFGKLIFFKVFDLLVDLLGVGFVDVLGGHVLD